MSSWTTINLHVATLTPEAILSQQQRIKQDCGYFDLVHFESPWFRGSEGHAEIGLCRGYLAILDKGLRDRSVKEDGDTFLADFRDILRQCRGAGYLHASDGRDILQIEAYDGVETITRFANGYSRFHAYFYGRQWRKTP